MLVNNAGNMYRGPLAELDEHELLDVFHSNVVGGDDAHPGRPRPPRRRVAAPSIFIGSMHSQRAFPGASPYAATKGAVETLTGVLAAELGPQGVRVSCVRPGGVFTEINQRAGLFDDATALARLESLAPAHALGRHRHGRRDRRGRRVPGPRRVDDGQRPDRRRRPRPRGHQRVSETAMTSTMDDHRRRGRARSPTYDEAKEVYRQKELRQALYDAGEVSWPTCSSTCTAPSTATDVASRTGCSGATRSSCTSASCSRRSSTRRSPPSVAAGRAELVDLGHRLMMNLAALTAGVDRPLRTPDETRHLYDYLMRFIEGATLAHYTGDRDAKAAEIAGKLADFDVEFLTPVARAARGDARRRRRAAARTCSACCWPTRTRCTCPTT